MSYGKTENNGYEGYTDGHVVRIRGLPWSASTDEVASFLSDCNIVGGKAGIHFTYVRDGRPSGEAYIEMCSDEDVVKSLSKDKAHMGKRYIEVFRSKRSEMDWVVKRSGPNQADGYQDAVIRLRGLPFGCSKEEIAQFFTGLEIVPNGITLLHDAQGRTTGDAYVQFASQEIAERAQGKHKERIGHRYIEIFKSSLAELRNSLNTGMVGGRGMGMNRMGMGGGMGRPGPYDRQERFGMGSGMGFRGRGRGNIKGTLPQSPEELWQQATDGSMAASGYYEDYEEDEFGYGGGFGGGYGGNRGGMGRRGGMGGMDGSMDSGRGGGARFGMGGRTGGGGGGGGGGRDAYESQTGHCVHLRGLPFAATEQDIIDFFKPLNPVNVVIHYNSDGRASGEADVDFATHDEAKEAMRKDRGTMQHRYIELFLKSSPVGGNGGGGYNSGYGNMNAMGVGYGNMGGGMATGNPNYTAF